MQILFGILLAVTFIVTVFCLLALLDRKIRRRHGLVTEDQVDAALRQYRRNYANKA